MQLQPTPNEVPTKEMTEQTPDDSGGIYFSSFVRITNPETGEVLVEKRGDQ
jgi:hypothetical protein